MFGRLLLAFMRDAGNCVPGDEMRSLVRRNES
jgi:hypothetical protein